MEQTSVSLGDALQRAALSMQSDLQNTLLMMRSLDPELRTTELKQYIARSRKKAFQLFALTRWMSSPGVSQCFRAIADYNGQLSMVDQELARNLDEMYFIHAGIYTMRSRPYEVTTAMDISATGTYVDLPTSVFSCGKPEFPEPLDPSYVVDNLNLCLKAKLGLSGALVNRSDIEYDVSEGLLKLTKPGFFCLYLTLSHLSERASWTVLNARLLVDVVGTRHSGSDANTEQRLGVLQDALLQRLRAAVTAVAGSATQATHTLKLSSASNDGAVDHAIESETDADGVSWDDGLSVMLDLCEAAALDHSVEVLAQELAAAQTLPGSFRGVYQANLRPTSGLSASQTILSLRLWESVFSRDHQYEVRLWRPPTSPESSTEGPSVNPQGALSLAIYTKLTYRHPTLIFADENRSFPIPGASLALHADAYVLHGCDASRLLSDALAVLARSRLHVLVARLVHTLDTLPAGAAEAVSVTQHASYVELRHARIDASLYISVDARNGKYCIDDADLQGLNGPGRRSLELFAAEINNVEAESYCSDYLLKHGLPFHHASATTTEEGRFRGIALQPLRITTLDGVLEVFALHRLALYAGAALGDKAASLPNLVPTLFPSSGLGNSKGFAYNVRFWEDTEGAASYAQTKRAFQAVYPYAHSVLDKAALEQAALSTALPPRPRTQAKKRGFSEAALEGSAVPGGFVSAADLAAEETVAESARYPEITTEKSVLALYLLLALRADANSPTTEDSAEVAACLCRVTMKSVQGKVEVSAPVVLHHSFFGSVALNAASQPAEALKQHLVTAHSWAEGLVTKTAAGNYCSFQAGAETLLLLGNAAVARFSNTADAGNDTLMVTIHTLSEALTGAPAGWKPVLNSLPGHMQGKGSFGAEGQLLMDAALAFRTVAVDDALELICLKLRLPLFPVARTEATAAVGLFATRLVEQTFSSWLIPKASANINTEVLKRVKFAHVLVALVVAICTAPLSSDAPDLALRCVQFHVTAAPTTTSASGCSATLLFTTYTKPHSSYSSPVPVSAGKSPTNAGSQASTASVKAESNSDSANGSTNGSEGNGNAGNQSAKPTRSPTRMLVVDVSYTCSTMRGQGRSINHAEISEATLRDLSPVSQFSVQRFVSELLADGGAALREALVSFVQ